LLHVLLDSFCLLFLDILSFITTAILDSSVIVGALEDGKFNEYFWSVQLMLLLQGILAVMGACGFRRKFRKRFEPSVPEQFMIRGDENPWSLKAMIMAAKPDALWWIVAIIFAIGQGVATISFLEYTSDAISAISDNKPFDEFRNALLWFAVAGIGAGVCAMGSGALFGVAGMRYVARIRVKLLNSLMIQEMAFFDTVSPGALIGHMTSDTDKLCDIKDFIPWFITPGCQVIFGAYTLFKTSWQLAMVICALLIVEFLEASIRSKHITHRFMGMYVRANRGSSEKATEALASLITIRLFGQEKREEAAYARKANGVARIGVRKEVLESIFQGVEVLLHATVVGLGTLYSYNLIEDGLMPKSGLQEFVLVGVQLVASFQDVIKTTPLFAEVTGPAAIILSLIERIPKMDANTGETPQSLGGHIAFKNVRSHSSHMLDASRLTFLAIFRCLSRIRAPEPRPSMISTSKFLQEHQLRSLVLLVAVNPVYSRWSCASTTLRLEM
jgi:ABC-type multidrug transport system fused ATPase/permease subunit